MNLHLARSGLISSKQIVLVLKAWGFKENTYRTNVIPKAQFISMEV